MRVSNIWFLFNLMNMHHSRASVWLYIRLAYWINSSHKITWASFWYLIKITREPFSPEKKNNGAIFSSTITPLYFLPSENINWKTLHDIKRNGCHNETILKIFTKWLGACLTKTSPRDIPLRRITTIATISIVRREILLDFWFFIFVLEMFVAWSVAIQVDNLPSTLQPEDIYNDRIWQLWMPICIQIDSLRNCIYARRIAVDDPRFNLKRIRYCTKGELFKICVWCDDVSSLEP